MISVQLTTYQSDHLWSRYGRLKMPGSVNNLIVNYSSLEDLDGTKELEGINGTLEYAAHGV